MSLLRLLIERDVATAKQVEEASARRLVYGGDFLTNLYEVALPDEHRLVQALSDATGLPPGPAGALLPSEDAMHALSADTARRLNVVPLGRDLRGAWVAAVAEPPSDATRLLLGERLGTPNTLVVVPYLRLAEALADLYGAPMPRRVARALLRAAGLASVPPASTPFADWAQSQSDALAESVRPASLPPDSLRVLHSQGFAGTAGAARGRGRRRGPLTLSFLRAELEQAKTREEVLDVFFEFAAPFFEFSAFWLLSGDIAEGYAAHGDAPQARTLPQSATPIRGVLAAVRDMRAGGLVYPAWNSEDAALGALTGRNHGRGALLVPIVVATRTVAVLYGDDSEGALDVRYLADIQAAAPYASAALERLILTRRRSVAATPQSIVRPPPPPPPAVPVSFVDPHVWTPSKSAPPAGRVSFAEQELPSMIIDVSDHYTPLVERAAAGDQLAAAELVRAGHEALPALVAAFPGPCVQVQDSDALPNVYSAGALLSLLLALGDVSASSVAPFLQDSDETRRFWSTMMFTELCSARALPALAERAADSSGRVRRAAVQALRRASAEVPKAVVEALTQARVDAHDREDARRALVFALGETGAPLAVPSLVDALADSSEDVVQTAHHALRRLTFQDLGRDARRWVSWARTAMGRHAIEWMMDGVLSESSEVRTRAASEFARATGVQLELPPAQDRARVETLYDELYAWWNSTGRAQFGGVSL